MRAAAGKPGIVKPAVASNNNNIVKGALTQRSVAPIAVTAPVAPIVKVVTEAKAKAELDIDLDELEVGVDDEEEVLQDHEGPCNMSLEESMSASLVVEERLETSAVDDIDELDEEDPQCVVEYVNDIYVFLRAKEARHQLDAGYMRKTQSDLTPGMRGILLDWLADVGLKFKLLNDTTHMTVMLLDRYLAARHNVSRKQLQLVGVACMLIASKYEEIYAPEVRDFEYICDGAFTKEEILTMEVHVLNTLGFDICHPTPLHFLRRFSKAARSDSECHTLAKYLTELAAVHYESLVFAPSMLAAASVLLARSMHANGEDTPFSWNATMRHYTGYTREELMPCVQALLGWGRECQAGTAKLTAVYRKYSKRFFGVALIPFPDNM